MFEFVWSISQLALKALNVSLRLLNPCVSVYSSYQLSLKLTYVR